MRLSKEMIQYLSVKIIGSLENKRMIEIDSLRDKVIENVGIIIRDELAVEDRLDDEVKGILDAHEKRLDKEGVDYRKMFLMIKNKIAREREIIL